MDLDYYLAIPYVLALETVQLPDGEWVRRAEFPELPGCHADAHSAVEAIEKLAEEQVRYIQRLLDLGAPVPTPRPPLPTYGQALSANRLAFARWLVQKGRIDDEAGAKDAHDG